MAITPKRIIFTEREDNPLEKIIGPNTNFYNGADDLVNLNFDPILPSSRAFIWWVQLPSWFEKDPDLKNYKAICEKNFRGLSGISDIELQSVTQNVGFANHDVNYASGMQRGNTNFTISHKEYMGSPMRKMYYKWTNYIMDNRTNRSLYSEVFDVDYGARNHTGQLLYMTVRPNFADKKRKTVEFAMLWTNVYPTMTPLSIYNFELGDQNSPTLDIPFNGVPEISPEVEEYAQKILVEKILSNDDTSTGIGVKLTGLTNDTESLKRNTSSLLREIYGTGEAESAE